MKVKSRKDAEAGRLARSCQVQNYRLAYRRIFGKDIPMQEQHHSCIDLGVQKNTVFLRKNTVSKMERWIDVNSVAVSFCAPRLRSESFHQGYEFLSNHATPVFVQPLYPACFVKWQDSSRRYDFAHRQQHAVEATRTRHKSKERLAQIASVSRGCFSLINAISYHCIKCFCMFCIFCIFLHHIVW